MISNMDSIIDYRPNLFALIEPQNDEALVRECVRWLTRVLRPTDEPFFYHVVDELLADLPENLRLEVQSRVYQLIPRTSVDALPKSNSAWLLD